MRASSGIERCAPAFRPFAAPAQGFRIAKAKGDIIDMFLMRSGLPLTESQEADAAYTEQVSDMYGTTANLVLFSWENPSL